MVLRSVRRLFRRKLGSLRTRNRTSIITVMAQIAEATKLPWRDRFPDLVLLPRNVAMVFRRTNIKLMMPAS